MTLTYNEETRLKNVEETTQSMKTLIDNACSVSQLKQLLTSCNESLRRVDLRVDAVEIQLQEILVLARKLQ